MRVTQEELDSYRRGVESGVMKSATPNVVRQLLAEIERLRRERAAAIRLLKHRDRLDWGWNRHQQVYGYYLDWQWVGVDLEDVVRAEAEKENDDA